MRPSGDGTTRSRRNCKRRGWVGRCSGLTTSCRTFWPRHEYVIKEGAIYSPSGDGKIPYIAASDVAAVAFVTLTKPGHLGKKYVLTGGEAISYRQAAEIIGRVIGKTLRFVDESPEQARARRVREGVPPAVIESVLAIGAYQRAGGKTVTITTTVADLTGRPPRTVAEFVQEHAAIFRG